MQSRGASAIGMRLMAGLPAPDPFDWQIELYRVQQMSVDRFKCPKTIKGIARASGEHRTPYRPRRTTAYGTSTPRRSVHQARAATRSTHPPIEQIAKTHQAKIIAQTLDWPRHYPFQLDLALAIVVKSTHFLEQSQVE